MNNPKLLLFLVLFGVLFLAIYAAAFIVEEAEQAVITRFGEIQGEPITTPGIHFKLPFIEKVHKYDKRFLAWDGDRDQIPTKDGRFIWVDTYARWRISDSKLFLQRVTDERGAQSRLDDILDSETKSAIARYDLVELIRTSNAHVGADSATEASTADQSQGIGVSEMVDIKVGRSEITKEIIEACAPKTLELGIELLDLQFKRIKFQDDVQKSVFERMTSERNRIAELFRSEGQGEASRILGSREKDLKEIESEAYRQAEEIKGRADAEATSIYASAYDRSQDTRDFYRFLKTLETYENTLTEKDWLILTTESEFFKYLRNQQGQ